MGTTYHVTVVARGSESPDAAVRRCIDGELEAADRHLSTYAPDSEIARLNRSRSTDWIPVSEPLYDVLTAAMRVHAETDGAFDVTVAPLVRLWGFGANAEQGATVVRPDPEFIHDAMASVGQAWLELRSTPERAVRKGRVPLELDVDGIAPGYTVDRIGACLERAGLARYLVELGGEVRARGMRPDGRPWQVAVEKPLAGAREPYAGIELRNASVSTSGGYRSERRLDDGRVISHTIDPRIGEPVTHDLVSVTVVYADTMHADAYATALLVLGPREGPATAEQLGLAALFLERTSTPGQWRERATAQFERLRRPAP
jgi:thiamine biosynthesis lipoprotein